MNDTSILDETSETLLLLNVDANSGGSYTCRVSNQAGNADSSMVLYIVPYITTVPPMNVNRQFGESATVTCEAEGFPAPNITWYEVDNIGEVSETTTVVSEDVELEFAPISFDNFGTYRCEASASISGGVLLEAPTRPVTILTGN